MPDHAIFVAPFFMDATLRFIKGASDLPNVRLTLISQEPLEHLPHDVRTRLAGHWRIDDALNPGQLVAAARELEQRFGKARSMIGMLEQLQVPLAVAREALGIEGLSAEASRNFRDKARMKTVLTEAGVPCARHVLAGDAAQARAFAEKCGFPLVVKPPAGAGAKNTFRIDNPTELETCLHRFPPKPENPSLFEEFVRGAEYSFESVVVNGQPVWHSISRYHPSPLEVLENAWIQWCVLLPRDISGPEFDPIRAAGFKSLAALGLETGLSHMEWFKLANDRIAISEVGARPPGAQITSLLSWAHDLDFYRAWPRLMILGEFEPPERKYAVGAAYVRGQSRGQDRGMGRGRVRRITGLDEAQRRCGSLVVEVRLPKEGQAPSDSYEGDGYIIVRHPETAVVEQALRDILSMVRVELE